MRAWFGYALVLAAMLGGCAEFPQGDDNSYTQALRNQSKGDPAFRLSELKIGLTKTELDQLYPNRMVLSADDSDEHEKFYYVEPSNLTAGSMVMRDRLLLRVHDGTLAAYEVVRGSSPVVNPAMVTMASATPSLKPPAGGYGVQVAARSSEAEARALIDQMRAKYPSLLAQRWATIQRAQLPRGLFYRVIIGPLASAQEAQQLCQDLRTQGAECFPKKT